MRKVLNNLPPGSLRRSSVQIAWTLWATRQLLVAESPQKANRGRGDTPRNGTIAPSLSSVPSPTRGPRGSSAAVGTDLHINSKALLLCHQECQIHGESIAVMQNESIFASDAVVLCKKGSAQSKHYHPCHTWQTIHIVPNLLQVPESSLLPSVCLLRCAKRCGGRGCKYLCLRDSSAKMLHTSLPSFAEQLFFLCQGGLRRVQWVDLNSGADLTLP